VLDTTIGQGGVQSLVGATSRVVSTSVPPRFHNEIHAVVKSPVDIHLYDTEGRHFGVVYGENGDVVGLDEQIDGVIYTGADSDPEFMLLPQTTAEGYTIRIRGIDDGSCKLSLGFASAGGQIQHRVVFQEIEVSPVTAAEFSVSDNTECLLNIDFDGDGNYEGQVFPDEHTTAGLGQLYLPIVIRS